MSFGFACWRDNTGDITAASPVAGLPFLPSLGTGLKSQRKRPGEALQSPSILFDCIEKALFFDFS